MALAAGGRFLLLFLVVTAMVHGGWTLELGNGTKLLRRGSFPAGFVFGAASAAYQYEGGAREGGKGASIWDTFAYEHPDKIADGSNGDVAIDSYHRYKEDVNIMKGMGLDAYRFSISWTRILPNGSLSGGVNKEGINYYNNLINDLISNGLLPWVTLFHWDSPQALEERYGGFLSQDIVEDFQDYAEVCFMEFGDRVKHWITFNEPASFCSQGYSTGSLAPGRCSPWGKGRCSAGDSGREPYIACHHQLLAHAAVVGLYRQKYQEKQGGRIGITLNCNWFVPYSGSKSNHAAAQRALDFVLGWLMDPLTRGNYPFIMRAFVQDRLPRFTEKQSEELKGSLDFIGINYYTTSYVYDVPPCNNASTSFITDARFELTAIRNGIPIGPKAASDWLYIYPQGIRKLLLYIKTKYNNPVIYITENGVDEFNNKTAPLKEALKDDTRINYHHNHLLYLRRAISDGVDVRGYFAWSLLDNFEWASGYTVRFGINFVDYKDGLKRYPKKSSLWFHKFLGN